ATGDAVEAAAVDGSGVPGGKPPTVAEAARGGIGPVEVTVEQRRPPHQQLAHRLAVVRRVVTVLLDEPRLDAGQWQSDPAGPPFAAGAGADGDERFRHPVALDRRLAGELAEPLEHRDGQGGAARDEQAS